MKRVPTRSLAYRGILTVKATNKNQEDYPEDGSHDKDWHRMLQLPRMGSVFQYTFQQGQTPILPSVYNMEVVQVPVDRSSAKIQAWLNLNA